MLVRSYVHIYHVPTPPPGCPAASWRPWEVHLEVMDGAGEVFAAAHFQLATEEAAYQVAEDELPEMERDAREELRQRAAWELSQLPPSVLQLTDEPPAWRERDTSDSRLRDAAALVFLLATFVFLVWFAPAIQAAIVQAGACAP